MKTVIAFVLLLLVTAANPLQNTASAASDVAQEKLELEWAWTAGSSQGVEECVETSEFYIQKGYSNSDLRYLIYKEVTCEPLPENQVFCWKENGVEKCIKYQQLAGTKAYLLPFSNLPGFFDND